MRNRAIAFSRPLAAGVAMVAVALVLPSLAAATTAPTQTTMGRMTTITGEVTAVDPATRQISFRGPLGGLTHAKVDPDVKNLGQVKVGDMLSISYYESTALSASKAGEPNPLFTGGETSTAAPGEMPAYHSSEQVKQTVTVFSTDPEKSEVVFEGADGTLYPVKVTRPENARKLQQLRAGDKVDVVMTEAVVAKVMPAAPGQKPSMTTEASTLIIERGEVVTRSGSELIVRDERGRRVRVSVDPSFKFMLNGQEVTVFDIKPGTKITRAALRVLKVESE